ncbi:MAG: hypothetical protein A2Y25_11505 [Candidatus Melainabacteria bacterium GWF2_37_15]|nr:MAG: hypothetical protein A2Y25_11505 [Candidatus Melainabacteria bacterium GWF2_37_15]
MDFTSITVQILKALADIAGSWGLAIILLTLVVRLIMWPLSLSQQRSMRKMQQLAPKLKEIQNRYKSNPQQMQQKMGEFYKEHSFNPFGGCFPLLLQMPIFILLYTALMSPQFTQLAGDSSFLFIKRLDSPLRSHAGQVGDMTYGVGERDTFAAAKTAKIYLKDGKVQNVEITDYKKALEIQGSIIPGEPVDFKMDLYDLKLPVKALEEDFEKAEIEVINNSTKEMETLTFEKKGTLLFAQAKTNVVEATFHYDVLVLILIFGATMYFAQKVMTTASKTANMDPNQQAMQQSMAKIMPIMITGMFIFFPIPAGVLLYMIVSNVIQVIQTVSANKIIEREEQAQKSQVIDVEATEVTEEEKEQREKGSFSGQKKKGKW